MQSERRQGTDFRCYGQRLRVEQVAQVVHGTEHGVLTALIRNFYLKLMDDKHIGCFGLKPTSRIKTFVFRFVSVAAKWIRISRQYVLNVYTENQAYRYVFNYDMSQLRKLRGESVLKPL